MWPAERLPGTLWELASRLGIIMTVWPEVTELARDKNQLMNPSPPASDCMCFAVCWRIQSTEMRHSHFQGGSERGLCGQLETSGWRWFQRASRSGGAAGRYLKEAGGWADGDGRVYTLRTAGTTAQRSEWQRLPDASFVGTKQQVRATESPHSRHPRRAEAK